MSEREWKPKVGERVAVIGLGQHDFTSVIKNERLGWSDWFELVAQHDRPRYVHLRNLDPVLEDERTGKPRPPIQKGEEVEVTFKGQCYLAGCGLMILNPRGWIYLVMASDPRVRQIERRRENRGREARKS